MHPAPASPATRAPAPATFGHAGTPARSRLARGTDLRDRLRLAAISTHPALPRYLAWPARPARADRCVPVFMSLAGVTALAVGVLALRSPAPPALAALAGLGLLWLLGGLWLARRQAAATRARPEAWLAVAIACDAGDGDQAAPSVRLLLADGRHLDLWTTRPLALALRAGDVGVAYRRADRLVGFWRAG